MKSRNPFLLLLCCILIVFGCKNYNGKQSRLEVIEINASDTVPLNLSVIAESSEIIKLEASEACIMDNLLGLEESADYIFARDRKNLYQFDRKGKFIRKIGTSGKGPHEYNSINCFTIDAQSKKVLIGTLGKILCFDFEGNFILEIKKYKFFDYLKVVNGQLWTFYQQMVKSDQKPLVYQYRVDKYSLEDGIIKDSLLIKSIKLEKETYTYSPKMQYLSELRDKLYLYCPVLVDEPVVRDTLYIFQNNSLVPVVKLDFSDYKITGDAKKNVYITNIFRTKGFLFAEYFYRQKNKTFMYDFAADKKYTLNAGINDNIYGTGAVSLVPLNLTSGQVYFAKNGYELEGKIDGVNENSNPVVFFVKLKE